MDVLRIRTQDEIKKKHARRRKREREKAKHAKIGGNDATSNMDHEMSELVIDDEVDEKIKLADTFTPHLVVRASGKIRSLSFSEEPDVKNATQVIHAFKLLQIYANSLDSFLPLSLLTV